MKLESIRLKNSNAFRDAELRDIPRLCVEAPENQFYPKLFWELFEEFREYAQRGGQLRRFRCQSATLDRVC